MEIFRRCLIIIFASIFHCYLLLVPGFAITQYRDISQNTAIHIDQTSKSFVRKGTFYSSIHQKESPFYEKTTFNPQTQTIHTREVSDFYILTSTYNAQFQTQASQTLILTKPLIELTKHNQRHTKKLGPKNELSLLYYLNNKKIDSKSIRLSSNTFYGNTGLLFQGMLLANKKIHFECEAVIESKGMTINLIHIAKPISNLDEYKKTYPFPQDFISKLQRYSSFIVVESYLSGILNFLYPHKFHILLEPTPPHHVVGFWGGEAKHADYVVIEEIIDLQSDPNSQNTD